MIFVDVQFDLLSLNEVASKTLDQNQIDTCTEYIIRFLHERSEMLTAHNIHVCYSKKTIVDNISLTLETATLTALLGPKRSRKNNAT